MQSYTSQLDTITPSLGPRPQICTSLGTHPILLAQGFSAGVFCPWTRLEAVLGRGYVSLLPQCWPQNEVPEALWSMNAGVTE